MVHINMFMPYDNDHNFHLHKLKNIRKHPTPTSAQAHSYLPRWARFHCLQVIAVVALISPDPSADLPLNRSVVTRDAAHTLDDSWLVKQQRVDIVIVVHWKALFYTTQKSWMVYEHDAQAIV